MNHKERSVKNLNYSQIAVGYLMILPAMGIFLVFSAYCIIKGISYSFYQWDGIGEMIPVGLGNFLKLASDQLFWKSLYNNTVYAFGIIVFGVFPGLILAYLLSTPNIHGRTSFRFVYFLPRIISPVIYGVIWQWIYNPRNGLLPIIFKFLRITMDDFAMLGNINTAMLGIIITGGWTYFGFCMVIFLASFQGIDRSMEESAIIDGASKVKIFYSIVLPAIRPVINMVVIYTIIDSFKVFDLVLVMTDGGPDNSTSIMTFYIYKQAFRMNQYGYGMAVSMALAVLMLVFTVIYQKRLAKGETD
ncbi:MAG: sugar ABC transporter permease [Treponema sp.]|jgi:raffinose/stachyose/melibiose transport system permease protein|nr:sugar ABC transporter permease [Treponema sp.]